MYVFFSFLIIVGVIVCVCGCHFFFLKLFFILEFFSQMRDNYYRLGEGFLIVYSITMRDTFVSVNRFYDHILQVKGIDDVSKSFFCSYCIVIYFIWSVCV